MKSARWKTQSRNILNTKIEYIHAVWLLARTRCAQYKLRYFFLLFIRFSSLTVAATTTGIYIPFDNSTIWFFYFFFIYSSYLLECSQWYYREVRWNRSLNTFCYLSARCVFFFWCVYAFFRSFLYGSFSTHIMMANRANSENPLKNTLILNPIYVHQISQMLSQQINSLAFGCVAL